MQVLRGGEKTTQNTNNLEIRENKARTQYGGRWVQIWQYNKDSQREVEILVFDEGSEYGIDGGKISKLRIQLYRNGFVKTEACYDRGWDGGQPTGKARDLYNQIIEMYN